MHIHVVSTVTTTVTRNRFVTHVGSSAIGLLRHTFYKTTLDRKYDRNSFYSSVSTIEYTFNFLYKVLVITQWAVLAIRNLCHNNPENQAVLAALKMEGLDRNVAVLEEMGIEAEVRGEKVYVKPTGNK